MLKSPWMALLGLSIIFLNAGVDLTIISTSLPVIQNALQLSLVQSQWVMDIYLLLNCVLLIVMGRLSDLYGRRLFLYISIALFFISTLVSGLAPNGTWLIIGRGIQGVVEAILLPVSLGIISSLFVDHERGKAVGIWSSFVGIGMIIGGALSGIIILYLGWRWTFFIKIPILLLGLILCLFSIPESRGENSKHGLDWTGFVLITIAVTCLIVPINQGQVWGYDALPTLILFVIALLSFISLYFVEHNHPNPAVPPSLLQNATFVCCAVAQFSLLFCISSLLYFAPLYLQFVYNIPTTTLGYIMTSIFISMLVASPISGYLVDKIGAKIPLLLGFLALLISIAIQIFFTPDTPLSLILLAFVAFGISWGLMLSASATAALNTVPTATASGAIGVLWTIQIAGGAIGLAITGALFRGIFHAQLVGETLLPPVEASPAQQKFIHLLLTTHEKLQDILSQFSQSMSSELLPLFQISFMHGYNDVMILLFIVALIGGVLVSLFMKPQKH